MHTSHCNGVKCARSLLVCNLVQCGRMWPYCWYWVSVETGTLCKGRRSQCQQRDHLIAYSIDLWWVNLAPIDRSKPTSSQSYLFALMAHCPLFPGFCQCARCIHSTSLLGLIKCGHCWWVNVILSFLANFVAVWWPSVWLGLILPVAKLQTKSRL